MRSPWFLIIGLLAAACSPAGPAAYAPPTRVTLAGTVRDAADGTPLAARLTLGGTALTAATDGTFRFTGVATGEHTLRIEHKGYEPHSRKLLAGTAGLDVEVLLFPLAVTRPPEKEKPRDPITIIEYAYPPTARLVGRVRVYGSFGDGGVTVRLAGTQVTTVTAADGTYVLDGIAPGTYDIEYAFAGPSAYAPVTLPQFQFFAGVAERFPEVPLYRGALTYVGAYDFEESWHAPDGQSHVYYDDDVHTVFATSATSAAPVIIAEGYFVDFAEWTGDGAWVIIYGGEYTGIFISAVPTWQTHHVDFVNGFVLERFAFWISAFAEYALVEIATGRAMPLPATIGFMTALPGEDYFVYDDQGVVWRLNTATGVADAPVTGATCAGMCEALPNGLVLLYADAATNAHLVAWNPASGVVYPTTATTSILVRASPQGDHVIYTTPALETYLVAVTGGTPRLLGGEVIDSHFVDDRIFTANFTSGAILSTTAGVTTVTLAGVPGTYYLIDGQFVYIAGTDLRRVDLTNWNDAPIAADVWNQEPFDATRLLYWTGSGGLYLAAAAGGTPVFLAGSNPYVRPTDDPDWVYYWIPATTVSALYRVPVSGGAPQLVAPSVNGLVFSPDRSRVAYLDAAELLHWATVPGGTPSAVGRASQFRFAGNDLLEYIEQYAPHTDVLRLSDGARDRLVPSSDIFSEAYYAAAVAITLPYYTHAEYRQYRKDWR